jgi:predicted ATPase
MARLDRLGPARDLIQTAAVIGREIPYRLLQRVADLDEPQLRQQLEQLTDSELLYRRGAPPEASYLFKHALIQDTAYEALLKSKRQKLHGAIGAALEHHFKERAEAEPEVLAEHFEKANQNERGIQYYKLAAEKAEAKTAHTEAINYAGQALKLLPTSTAGVAREQIELPLLLIQALGLAILHGYSHAEVRPILERAEELLSDSQDPFAQMKTLGLLWMTDQFGGQFETAIRFGERMGDAWPENRSAAVRIHRPRVEGALPVVARQIHGR